MAHILRWFMMICLSNMEIFDSYYKCNVKLPNVLKQVITGDWDVTQWPFLLFLAVTPHLCRSESVDFTKLPPFFRYEHWSTLWHTSPNQVLPTVVKTIHDYHDCPYIYICVTYRWNPFWIVGSSSSSSKNEPCSIAMLNILSNNQWEFGDCHQGNATLNRPVEKDLHKIRL
jgi:hypothetical protein